MSRRFFLVSGALALAVLAAEAAPRRAHVVHRAHGAHSAPVPKVPAPAFTLDIATPGSQDVALTIQTPSTIPFKIMHTGGPVAGKVTLDLAAFSGTAGVTPPLTLSIDDEPGPARDHVDGVAFGQPLLAGHLHVPELPAGEKYSGRLILTVPGQAQPITWNVVLTAAKAAHPAALVLDRNTVTLTAVRPWCLWNWCPFAGDNPAFAVHVREKTGNVTLVGVTARLEPGVKGEGSGFDPKKNLVVTFNGNPVPDIFVSPKPGERDVPAGDQATMTLAFNDLGAGEYTIPLRFGAKNSSDDDLQRLAITVQVRNHLFGAILVIILAVVVSAFATRVLSTMRQRAQFLSRLQALRPAWLADEPPILPVIWLRSALGLAEYLSRRYWLTGQNEIDARLTAAERMLAVLEHLRRVREHIAGIADARVQQRATWRLDNLILSLPGGPLTEQEAAHFNAELDAFDAWCDPGKRADTYWTDLEAAIKARRAEILDYSVFPEEARGLASDFCAALDRKIAHPPMTMREKIEAQDILERLSVLWEARKHDAWVKKIVELHNWPGEGTKKWAPIEKVYEVIDDGWWSLINELKTPDTQAAQASPGKLKVEGPAAAIEAYRTVTFRLRPYADPDLFRSYLMQKKLTYCWKVEVFRRWQPWRAPQVLEVVSAQPQVAQYARRPGKVRASVRISYDGRKGPKVKQERAVKIRGSRDFAFWAVTERAGGYAFLLVLAGSVVSGITAFALAATFGSLKEYIALFTWGATLDQSRNFFQSLAAHKSSEAAKPKAAAATPAAPAKPAVPPKHAGAHGERGV